MIVNTIFKKNKNNTILKSIQFYIFLSFSNKITIIVNLIHN